VDREIAGLDAQLVLSGVAKLLLQNTVPRDGVGVLVLEDTLAGHHVVHYHVCRLVDDSELAAHAGQVQAPDSALVLDHVDRERVVHEDLQHLAVLQSHHQALASRRSTDNLDISDDCVQHPLALFHPLEIQELELLLLTEDDVEGRDHQKVALHRPLHRVAFDVVHVVLLPALSQLVDEHSVGKLHREPLAIHGDFLDVVLGLDSHLLLGGEVLDRDVRHKIAVRVPILVESVDRRKVELIHRHAPVVAPHCDVVLLGARCDGPDPIRPFADRLQLDAILGPERRLVVRPSKNEVFAVAEIACAARVVPQRLVLAQLLGR